MWFYVVYTCMYVYVWQNELVKKRIAAARARAVELEGQVCVFMLYVRVCMRMYAASPSC